MWGRLPLRGVSVRAGQGGAASRDDPYIKMHGICESFVLLEDCA